MRELKRILNLAEDERVNIRREISTAETERNEAQGRYRSWNNGFILKHIRKQAFAMRKEAADSASAKLEELQEQFRLTAIATEIDISPEQAEPFYGMRDAFVALCGTKMIWDTTSTKAVNQAAERSSASEAISREPVCFQLGKNELFDWEQKVPLMGNRNGGDLYFYPGFILYGGSKDAFGIVDCREVSLKCGIQKFVETQTVPSDSQVVERTWAKCNKDGSPTNGSGITPRSRLRVTVA